MLKRGLNIIFFIGLQLVCLSQNKQFTDSMKNNDIDRFRRQLLMAKNDSGRIVIMQAIGYYYETQNADSSLNYYNAALKLATEKSYAWAEAGIMASISGVMKQQGKLPEAFQLLFRSLKIAEETKIPYHIARAYRRLGTVYYDLENFPKSTVYLLRALRIDEENQIKRSTAIDHILLGFAYEKMNKLDSAAFHINIAAKENDRSKDLMQDIYDIDGNIKLKEGNYKQAAFSYTEGLNYAQKNNDLLSSSRICADISALNVKLNLKDSAIYYALKGLNYANEVSFKKGIILNAGLLAQLYDSIQPLAAFKYYKIAATAKDSLYGMNNIQTIQSLIATQEAKQRELEDAAIAYRNKLGLYGLLTGLAVLLIIAFILYRNNKHKQKANLFLQQQKEKIEITLSELKSTQAQLIQSEKMASLGELTAGIAHEIQNPLNFVNNFSEVTGELLEELKNEKLKVKTERDEQLENELINDIVENEKKINHHGKRADAIVKGMLQHSQTSTGKKESTNINALADEYLRLSYHGLRAKDKTFNAEIKTNFDNTIGKINIVPQDIGRVLLNLYNNAFYAVNEKSKQQNENYQPTISVSTKRTNNKLEIKVADNGNGIPQKVVDKIFQPFFTTKPTGQGTGLGLSLSYDIVKAHGGEIKVETKEGEGAEFIIELPI